MRAVFSRRGGAGYTFMVLYPVIYGIVLEFGAWR